MAARAYLRVGIGEVGGELRQRRLFLGEAVQLKDARRAADRGAGLPAHPVAAHRGRGPGAQHHRLGGDRRELLDRHQVRRHGAGR